MGHHAHLALREREGIMLMRRDGRGVSEIARAIGRDKSTVSLELKRNSCERFYRASTAQRRYAARRAACRRRRILDDAGLFKLVRDKFLGNQWPPEQIEGRLALELGASPVSDTAVYRCINAGRFDGCVGGKCRRKTAKCVRDKMPKALKGQPLASVALDRSKEFSDHAQVTVEIGVEFYFALPHHP